MQNTNSSSKVFERNWTDCPDRLYKFKYWDKNTSDLLKNNIVFFSSAKFFNDPFDSTIPIRFDKGSRKETLKNIDDTLKSEYPKMSRNDRRKMAPKIMKEKLGDKDHIRKQKEYQSNLKYDRFGIYSLTESKDSIVMWSHYTKSHTGICIGFDTQKLLEFRDTIFDKTKDIIYLYKVLYQEEYPFLSRYKMNEDEALIKSLIIKSIQWEYEKEWRMILIGDTEKAITLDEGIITEVILGCRMSENHIDEIKKALEQRNKKVELLQAKMMDEYFGLTFEKYDKL